LRIWFLQATRDRDVHMEKKTDLAKG